ARRPSTMVISTATVAKPTAPPVSSQLSAVSADNCELTPGWGGSGELRFDFGEKSVEESFEGVAVEADFLALGEAQHRALLGQPDPLRDRHHRAVLGHRRGQHADLVQRVAVAPFELRVAQLEPAVERR